MTTLQLPRRNMQIIQRKPKRIRILQKHIPKLSIMHSLNPMPQVLHNSTFHDPVFALQIVLIGAEGGN